MKVTRTERWILANQYRIMEALYPDDAEHLAEQREAIERGYELHYDWIAERVYDDKDTLSTKECTEVHKILGLHQALKRSYNDLADKSGIEERAIRFDGFDGNNETTQLAYSRYVLEKDGGGFADLDRGIDDLNSHYPTLDTYRRMLAVWDRMDNEHSLSRDQIVEILTARVHPSRRGEMVG